MAERDREPEEGDRETEPLLDEEPLDGTDLVVPIWRLREVVRGTMIGRDEAPEPAPVWRCTLVGGVLPRDGGTTVPRRLRSADEPVMVRLRLWVRTRDGERPLSEGCRTFVPGAVMPRPLPEGRAAL